jgi:hypothetical protein
LVYVTFFDDLAGCYEEGPLLGPFPGLLVDGDRLVFDGDVVAELLLDRWHVHAGPGKGTRWQGFRLTAVLGWGDN